MTNTSMQGQTKASNPEFTFGDRLAKARKRSGITQRELANVLGVSSNTILYWETGKYHPLSRKQYTRLANLLEVDVDWLDPEAELRNKCSDPEAA